jgi:hypothetical protein
LSYAVRLLGAASSSSRGLFAGGFSGVYNNTIEYITISTTGNSLDFGDLTVASAYVAGCSNAHGGL